MTGEEHLQQALAKHRLAQKHFEAMPPSHRREYTLWIDEAKLSITKERRAEQAVEKILAWDQSKSRVGYSGTPLAQKLGLEPGINIVVHAPAGYEEHLKLNKTVMLLRRLQPAANFIQAFYLERRRLVSEFATLAKNLRRDGQLWISWPKGSSKMTTDLNENSVREVGLGHGLVDVKVAAIDGDWSGLKFVYRRENR